MCVVAPMYPSTQYNSTRRPSIGESSLAVYGKSHWPIHQSIAGMFKRCAPIFSDLKHKTHSAKLQKALVKIAGCSAVIFIWGMIFAQARHLLHKKPVVSCKTVTHSIELCQKIMPQAFALQTSLKIQGARTLQYLTLPSLTPQKDFYFVSPLAQMPKDTCLSYNDPRYNICNLVFRKSGVTQIQAANQEAQELFDAVFNTLHAEDDEMEDRKFTIHPGLSGTWSVEP